MKQKYMSIEELKSEARDFSVNKLLKVQGYQNKPLSFDQAYVLGAFSLSPFVSALNGIFEMPTAKVHIQSVAALTTFHNRAVYQDQDSGEQIAGICSAVFDYDLGESSAGFVNPNVNEIIDNCGMGGDLIKTPNLSTIAALIASSGWR
jgi:hypothetical protein